MKRRKHQFKTSLIPLLGIASAFSIMDAQAASKITKVEFLGTQDPNQIVIQADGPFTFEKQENAQDKQIVLELKGAQLANKNVGRSLDTSSFNSKISLISPYQVTGQDTVRLVIQMKDMVSADVMQDGNSLRIKVPLSGGTSANSSIPDTAVGGALPPVTNPEPVNRNPTTAAETTAQSDRLKEFLDNRATKRFLGKAITLQVRDADVADIFRLIGEASGFNIIVGEDVKGKITLSLVDVPWDLALDTILHTLRLGAERNNNVLRIMTLVNLATEKQEELKAQKASEASAPRVTRVFPISYADLKELKGVLTSFGSTSPATGAADALQGNGIVQTDERTNSIIVRDTSENIDRMKKLVEILDTQTPQVMIEAKIVEATESFSRSLGGNLGISTTSGTGDNQAFASFGGGDPTGNLIGSGSFVQTGGSNSGVPSTRFGLSPSLGFLPGVNRLNAILNIGENESQLKVVSSPKTVVLNKRHANITQTQPVLVPSSSFVAGVGTVPITTSIDAKLSLEVTPTVSNDGSILLDVTIDRDIALTGGIGKRSLKTNVVVESGTTLVIGGIYVKSTLHTEGGFPVLRKIPVIGWLFGSDTNNDDRSELFIFITPRLLNEKEVMNVASGPTG